MHPSRNWVSGAVLTVCVAYGGAGQAIARDAAVTAQAAGVVPGAILCPDARTTQVVYRRILRSWTQHAQDAVTDGRSELYRGKARPMPELALYGCSFVPAGDPMILESNDVIPVVRATVAGKRVRGVTLPAMIGNAPG